MTKGSDSLVAALRSAVENWREWIPRGWPGARPVAPQPEGRVNTRRLKVMVSDEAAAQLARTLKARQLWPEAACVEVLIGDHSDAIDAFIEARDLLLLGDAASAAFVVDAALNGFGNV